MTLTFAAGRRGHVAVTVANPAPSVPQTSSFDFHPTESIATLRREQRLTAPSSPELSAPGGYASARVPASRSEVRPSRPPLHRVRLRLRQVGRPLPGVPGLGQRPGGRRPGAARCASVSAGPVTAPARPIAEVELAGARAVPTGIAEFDRVLGGGLVPGAVLLVAGEPGVGKSTLLLEVAHRVAAANGPALVVSGEESAGQVRLRAERIGALHEQLYLAAETELSAVLAHVEAGQPHAADPRQRADRPLPRRRRHRRRRHPGPRGRRAR